MEQSGNKKVENTTYFTKMKPTKTLTRKIFLNMLRGHFPSLSHLNYAIYINGKTLMSKA